MEVSGQLHAPAVLHPGEVPDTHWIVLITGLQSFYSIWGWVEPRAGLDVVEKWANLPCKELNPGRPAHGQSPYRLS
jgi:hypothetical protein